MLQLKETKKATKQIQMKDLLPGQIALLKDYAGVIVYVYDPLNTNSYVAVAINRPHTSWSCINDGVGNTIPVERILQKGELLEVF